MQVPVGLSHGPLSNVARQFGIYSVGAAVSLVSSVALLPVYATQFAPDQFGVVATGQIVALAVTTVARLGIGIGMFRFLTVYHAQHDTQAANAIVTTCLAGSTLCGLIATAVMLAGLRVFGTDFPSDVQLAGALIAVNITLSGPRELAEFALRAKQRAGAFVLLSSSCTVLSASLTAGLVMVLRGGVPGVFAATLLANAIAAPVAIYILRAHLATNALSAHQLKLALRFGIPGVPALLADWVTQYSDRFFLTRFNGLAQVGVYSMAYRVGLIEQQVLGAATQAAWDPFVLANYKNNDAAATIGRVATYFAIAGMSLVVLLGSSASTVFVLVHARHEYLAAAPVVFLIALANFFGLVQYLFLAPTSIRLRPELGTLLRALGAVVNTLLNVLLISRFGILGAAWATVLTFAISAGVTELVGRRLWRIAYEYRKLALILVGGLLVQACIQLAEHARIVIAPSGLEPLLAETVFIGWLFLTRVMTRIELLSIARVLRRFRQPAQTQN